MFYLFFEFFSGFGLYFWVGCDLIFFGGECLMVSWGWDRREEVDKGNRGNE